MMQPFVPGGEAQEMLQAFHLQQVQHIQQQQQQQQQQHRGMPSQQGESQVLNLVALKPAS
jgi:hypothetical protein